MLPNPFYKNKIIIKPFIYGSVSFNTGKRRGNRHDRRWCAYVRGVNNENISNYIKSVEFTLHESFIQRVRLLKKWPFELYETGWGEFDIKIKIELIDESAKPIDLVLHLALPPDSQPIKKPIVNEFYDEIIFVNPKPEVYDQLIIDNGFNKKIINNCSLNVNNNANINMMEIEDEKNIINNSCNYFNHINSLMEEDLEEKSQNESSINLNNKQIVSEKDKGLTNPIIPNVSQYFSMPDDSETLKQIEFANSIMIQKIEKLKEELIAKENEILKLNKEIKNLK